MKNDQAQKKSSLSKEDVCDFGRRQAHIQMNKEEERKQIGKMIKKI